MNTALLLIDIQEGLDDRNYYGKERTNLDAEKNCAQILSYFRAKNLPIYHICNDSENPASPLHPSKPGNAIKAAVAPLLCESVYRKNTNSAFIGTRLEADLKAAKIEYLVVVGLTAEHCISSSVRMAANLGFQVTLLSDATAAFSKTGINGQFIPATQVHEVTLANLSEEFATITTTADYIKKK